MGATDRDVIEGIRARRLPIHYRLPNPGDITRYGATPGVDCTAIITTAAAANREVIFPAGAWVISGTPTIPSGVVLVVLPGATFTGAGVAALGFYTNAGGYAGTYIDRVKVSGVSTTSGSGGTGPFIFNIPSDTVDAVTSSNGNFRLMNLIHGVSAGHTGGRSAIYALLNIVGAPGISPDGQPGYVGVEALTQINVNCGGTAGAITNYLGTVYGANPWARTVSGATYLYGCVSQETDISVAIGSNVGKKHAMTLNKTTGDFYQGDYDDAAFQIADQGGLSGTAGIINATSIIAGRAYFIVTVGTTDYTTVGSPDNVVNRIFVATGVPTGTGTVSTEIPPWNYGVSFGAYASQWPFNATSTLIYAQQRAAGVPSAIRVCGIEVNRAYTIAVTGTTGGATWTALGDTSAAPGTVGNTFVALRDGLSTDGTGTVTRGINTANVGVDFTNCLFKTAAFKSTGFSVGPAGNIAAASAAAIPAAGSTAVGITLTSTANFGVFAGSGVPTLVAAKGSLYLRSDGSSTSTRMYVATDSVGGWTNVTTAT